jgi:hypothetical protein
MAAAARGTARWQRALFHYTVAATIVIPFFTTPHVFVFNRLHPPNTNGENTALDRVLDGPAVLA